MTDRSEQAIITGYNGEEAVAAILRNRGYHVTQDLSEYWDLLVDNLLTVEVKTAKPSDRTDKPQKRWQFCLYSHRDRQKPIEEDLVILRCETIPPCHFIIPTFLIPKGLTKIDITSPNPWEYHGKWSLFRGRWELVSMVMAYILKWGRF